jgi:hypothetical protein
VAAVEDAVVGEQKVFRLIARLYVADEGYLLVIVLLDQVAPHDLIPLRSQVVIRQQPLVWECSDWSRSVFHGVLLVEPPTQEPESDHIEEIVSGHNHLDNPDNDVEDW